MKVQCIERIVKNGDKYQLKYTLKYPQRIYINVNGYYKFPFVSFYKNN